MKKGLDAQIDESLKEDKRILKAKQIKNLISLALLSNPEGVTLNQLVKYWLAPLNVRRSDLLRWLQGRGQLGKFLGGSFNLEETEPKEMTKIRFHDDEACWLAFVFQYDDSLNFGKYENKILRALFSPERGKYERDEYVLFHQGKVLSFIREGRNLKVVYPIPTPSKFINVRPDEEAEWKVELSIIEFSDFAKNIKTELDALIGLKDAPWTLIEPLIVRCKKEILRRIEEKGGLLISELKEAGLYGSEAETSR